MRLLLTIKLRGEAVNLQCEKCHHINPVDSNNCNQCGQPLIKAETDSQLFTVERQRIQEQFSAELTDEALQIKLHMLEAFQDKATKWVKVQFAAGATALTLVIAVLSYVGFSGFNAAEKYQRLIENSEKNITQQLNVNLKTMSDAKMAIDDSFVKINNDLIDRKNKIDEAFLEANAQINEKLGQLSQFDAERTKLYQERLSKTLSEVENLKMEVTGQLTLAKKIGENINKLENSRFRIIVHYREVELALYRENLAFVESALYEKGFIIDQNDIANVSTDRQEILYYSTSPGVVEKVSEIQKQLSTKYSNIPIRFEDAASLDSLQVVIKLCPQKNNISDSCVIK